jgi:hypothetical protein
MPKDNFEVLKKAGTYGKLLDFLSDKPKKTKKKSRSKEKITVKEKDAAVAEYLKKGGTIKKLPYHEDKTTSESIPMHGGPVKLLTYEEADLMYGKKRKKKIKELDKNEAVKDLKKLPQYKELLKFLTRNHKESELIVDPLNPEEQKILNRIALEQELKKRKKNLKDMLEETED